MKTSKQCPKCGGKDIYTNENITKRGERSLVAVGTFRSAYISTYLCVDCGYIEEYIAQSELDGGKAIEKIKKNWEKVAN